MLTSFEFTCDWIARQHSLQLGDCTMYRGVEFVYEIHNLFW